ncbi:zinc ribbon domain-containing protein [Halosimplex amylolyticum]|uniref:zinc ribbon domain-containing protein n=1 Tax=Halosimplex amylolyticum TaxID=3396616 RepID=UPI003F5696C3
MTEYPSLGGELLKGVLAVVALPVVVLLLLLGPFGWLTLGAAVLLAGVIRGRESSERAPERTNCPHCGARNDVDATVCSYCEEPMDAA